MGSAGSAFHFRIAGSSETSETLAFGPFRLFPQERKLLRDDVAVPIGGRALDLLIALTERPGEVISHLDLYNRVWPSQTVVDTSVRVHIAALRRLLDDGRGELRYIVNIPARGYAFVAPVERTAEPTSTPNLPAQPIAASLPPRLARMVGRDTAVGDLIALIARQRFVSVVGTGGIGKTTVAVAVAHALLAEFADAVCFVDLAMVDDPETVPAAVAKATGIELGTTDPTSALAAAVADRRLLLVLDNCEHVIDAAALLAEHLFAAAPSVHLLVTSRETLRVEGEHIHWLAPLVCPPERIALTAVQALAAPAVQLFMERAGASGYPQPLTDAEARLVADMCRKLDGIPLAIELAASRVGTHGLRGTADLLNDRSQLWWEGRRSAAPRQRTIHALLDWSFNLLSGTDQRVLCRLAGFADAFTLAGARDIATSDDLDMAQVAEALDRLVDKSLIWADAHAGAVLYRLHHMTRTYLLDRLSDLCEDGQANPRGGNIPGFPALGIATPN